MIFNEEVGKLDDDSPYRRGGGKGGPGQRKYGKNDVTDIYSLNSDTFYRDSGFPDIIDVRPLMSAREELMLPKDELFTANDIRSLVILPFSTLLLQVFPLIEYFVIFLFCGMIRLIYSTRNDISQSSCRSQRLELHGRCYLLHLLWHRLDHRSWHILYQES